MWETSSEKLDRLVFAGTLRVATDGFTWFCHTCKQHQVTPAIDGEVQPEWFAAIVDAICDHANKESVAH